MQLEDNTGSSFEYDELGIPDPKCFVKAAAELVAYVKLSFVGW